MGRFLGSETSRSLYLSGIGAIYAVAFGSYWLQYPGLLGARGLLPAAPFWRQVRPNYEGATRAASFLRLPCLLWFAGDGDAAVDARLEAIAAAGVAAGAAAAAGLHHGALFAFLFLGYLTLFVASQTWLGFQWDIFLLETGFWTVLYAPWCSLSARGEEAAGHPMAVPLRALWVKFMVMSGVVKVTANCPTWKRLTALEFHFASTCLPTAEAWYFHSLPPSLLRLGTAVMFLTELVAPWLLLAPATAARRAGCLAQIPLQALIMYSGNYNWFNLHTVVLLLPAWACDFSEASAWETFWRRRRWPVRFGVCAALAYAFRRLFPFSTNGSVAAALAAPAGFVIENRATVRFTKAMLDTALTERTLLYVYAILALPAAAYAARAPGRRLRYGAGVAWRLALAAAAAVALGVLLLPCESIAGRPVLPLLPGPLREPTRRAAAAAEPFRAASSYGLFRRMTGVGDAPGGAGFGGAPPSAVAVPAVVLEASRDGRDWREIPPRYAPFGVSRPPRRTAPHQPRLDWQLWFAALGHYQHNPWLLHLMYKIVTALPADDDALALLDVDAYPFADTPPTNVRASLYHYDFTRAPSAWARGIPGAVELAPGCNPFRHENRSDCDAYWTRRRVSEYVPAVDAAVLRDQVVAKRGWPTGPRVAAPSRAAALRRFVGWHAKTSSGGPLFVDGPAVLLALVGAGPLLLGALPRLDLRVRRRKRKAD